MRPNCSRSLTYSIDSLSTVSSAPTDVTDFAARVGLQPEDIGFSDFTNAGFWDVDDVLRPIFEEAEEALGREFPYPGDE